MMKSLGAAFVAFFCVSVAHAEAVRVAECVRDPALDYWAASDNRFCTLIMDEVFKSAGVEKISVPFGEDGRIDDENTDVICSAFRTRRLIENYNFSMQPIGLMHYALYASPARAMSMITTKITDWPSLVVGYSPVSQGQSDERERYFEQAGLSPRYLEFATSAGAVEALANGEIDVLFLFTPFGKRPEGVVEIVPIGDKVVHFAVRKDKPDLLARLNKSFRDLYIDRIDMFDELREQLLGVHRPQNRVRVAAYQRGGMFEVDGDGMRYGPLNDWLKTICGHTRWTLDFVYGDYDESLDDVRKGRLDIIGGIGFSPERRKEYLYPHTPIGMLRGYLWSKPGSPYKPGEPGTWRGMKVGLLAKTVSSERAKRQFNAERIGVTYKMFTTDKAMLDAYFKGDIDACVDVDQPALANEVALHVYVAHPIYICTAKNREDIFDELETAFEEICDDFPKYQRMISEHHYGMRDKMAALSIKEMGWLSQRVKEDKPIVIDFSPWPFEVFDEQGKPKGFIAKFLESLSSKTGLRFVPAVQTDARTAEAMFMRGDTELWIPYPSSNGSAVYGAVSVFSLPVPQNVSTWFGVEDLSIDFELFAKRNVPGELVSIIGKAVSDIEPSRMQEMFLESIAEENVIHRVFGLTQEELLSLATKIAVGVLLVVAVFGIVMGVLLKHQANRANAAAAAAEEHAKAKTRFLAMMSHELRTPLNAVIGFAEFISRNDSSEERKKDYVEGILLSSHALLELINDILDLSKLEAGAMHMRSGVCNMSQLLRELPAIFGYHARKHGVQLVVDAPGEDELPAVRLSQQGLRQIMINLVGNAAKFTTAGEIRIVVRWLGETNTLHIEVSDTGCGMSEQKLGKLFDPFVQDISSRMKASSGEMKGTGLGLPIVKRMVDAANGTITATSVVGKGTKFIIDIPNLEVVEGMPASVKSAEKAMRMASVPERALVVDDMAMNRKILGIHLSNLKVKDVRYAENGVKALEIMKEWLPDVVLTDMWMPEMDGTQLAEAMRRDRRLAEIPIVAVTADVDVGSTYDMSLFAKVIAKPVTGDKIKVLFGVD